MLNISKLLVLSMFLIIFIGCGGEAEVEILNNTDCYIHGDVEGETFGLNYNGSTTRTVDVGGFFSHSSDVAIETKIHATMSSSSPVVQTLSKETELKVDEKYTYEVYFYGFNNEYGLRLKSIELNSSIVGP